MRILVICQHYYPETFLVTEICEALVARGHEVTAVVGLPNYPSGIVPKEYKWFKHRREERNGVHVRRCLEIGRKNTKLGLTVNYLSYMLSACWRVLWMPKNFDVIYAYSSSPVLMSMPAAFLRTISGKKLLIYVLDIWPACLSAMNVLEGSPLYAFMKRVSRRIYARADVLAYSSKRFQAYFQRVHNLNVPDDFYLPQFANGHFDNVVEKEPAESWNFVFAGNIGKLQGVETVILAAELLKQEPVHFHILGNGSNYAACEALVRDKRLESVVTLYGRRPQEEMPGFYTMADALLVSMRNDPSVNDTLPAKVQSYMAASKPILGSIAGETAEIIKDAGCGLCAPPDDPAAFAEIVRAFIARTDQAQMGERAKAYYQRHFSKEGHMDHLEKMLKDLCEESDK
ncbi:MAG: glycosyltransferase family 4 protein [Eubacteriales bacterium]|nr:glycosyltransferase family 4 protein [Eubacteriales bacterium]